MNLDRLRVPVQLHGQLLRDICIYGDLALRHIGLRLSPQTVGSVAMWVNFQRLFFLDAVQGSVRHLRSANSLYLGLSNRLMAAWPALLLRVLR